MSRRFATKLFLSRHGCHVYGEVHSMSCKNSSFLLLKARRLNHHQPLLPLSVSTEATKTDMVRLVADFVSSEQR